MDKSPETFVFSAQPSPPEVVSPNLSTGMEPCGSTKRARVEFISFGRNDVVVNTTIKDEGLVEHVSAAVGCEGSKAVIGEKETSPYGPWLMVSYGRQGNSGFKGKSGRTGVINQGTADSMGGARKIVASGNGQKISGVDTEANSGKFILVKKGVRNNPATIRQKVSVEKGSGSRFDVLCDEETEMDNVVDKLEATKAIGSDLKKGSSVLTEITNGTSKQCLIGSKVPP
ncbi:hypothetical protein Q3G72_003250 [Acer saccharum]|nr:hypothetical protein Q3G72_003250 [Acer saccharum]